MQAVFTSSTILKLDNIDFLAADSVHLPFKSDSFDFIVIKDIIHHWMQSAEAMWEVQRILGPRGCLLSIEPNNRNFVTQISACLLPHERKVANHSPSFLIKFITGFGFQLDSADFYGFYVPYGPFYRVPKFLLPFLDLFEEVLKKMFPTYGGHFIASYKKIEPA